MNGGMAISGGMGRGLPSRLQKAATAANPGGAGGAASLSSASSSQRPAVGPLGGVVATAAQRSVESDPSKGEYAAWKHLDPSRNQNNVAYVPGLHPRPDEDEWEEAGATNYIPGVEPNPHYNNNKGEAEELKLRLPDAQLVRDFRSGKKNPISALTEYCTALHLTVAFKEVAPLKKGAGIAIAFANECSINGKSIRTASGRTKKEAKTAAARATFAELLGLSEDHLEDDDEGESKQLVDSFGRKVTLKSADSQWKDEGSEGAGRRRPLREDEILPRLNLDDESVDLRPKDRQPHPVELLTAWSARLGRPFVFDTQKLPDGQFRALVKMNGETEGEGFGETAKLAQREAASFVLQKHNQLPSQMPNRQRGGPDQGNEDRLSAIFQGKHQELIFEVVKAAQDRLGVDVDSLTEVPAAGFLLQRGKAGIGREEVVSLGIGASVANVLPGVGGRLLIDLHAFALARRGLVKFLLSEIRAYYNGDLTASIFRMRDDGMLELKPDHRLSLFMTHTPSGDADVFARPECVNDLSQNSVGRRDQEMHFPARPNPAHGQLRYKTEEGLTYSWDTFNPQRDQYPMSCSDKVLRCNVLGLQGSLLSMIMRPIYVNRIVWGSKFDHGVCVRAVCCRVDDDHFEGNAGSGFELKHPSVGRVTEYVVDSDHRLHDFPLAANWAAENDPNSEPRKKAVEILDPQTGMSFSWSPFRTYPANQVKPAPSRLCKAAAFYRFKDLVRGETKELISGLTYAQAKAKARAYNEVRDRFRDYLSRNHWGEWVRKPKDLLESFTK